MAFAVHHVPSDDWALIGPNAGLLKGHTVLHDMH